jgi:tetratricopeptide (TPR) repeat protein
LVQTDRSSGETRYRLLETIREYGAEQLILRGTAEVGSARDAHCAFFEELTLDAANALEMRHDATWVERLEIEHDNLRAALAHNRDRPEQAEDGLRFAAALKHFWRFRGYFIEGLEALDTALAHPDAQEPSRARTAAMNAAARLRYLRGDYLVATHWAEEALSVGRLLGDGGGTAEALEILAIVEWRQGNLDDGLKYIEESATTVVGSTSNPARVASVLSVRASLLDAMGNTHGARLNYTEALERYRELRDRRGEAETLGNLAYSEMASGELEAAQGHLDIAIELYNETQDGHVPYLWLNRGMIAIPLGDHQTAFQQFVATLSAADRIGAPPLTAYALLGLALCATARGEAVQAAQIHGAADKLFEEIGLVPEKFEASLRDIDRDRVRNALGDDLFLAAFTAGRNQPTDEAIAVSQQLPDSPARVMR